MNLMPSTLDMAARILTGVWSAFWIVKQPSPTGAAWVFALTPASLPAFVSFVPRNTPHFPYGYDVDPD